MRGRRRHGRGYRPLKGTRTSLSASPPRPPKQPLLFGHAAYGPVLTSVPADLRLKVMVHRWSTRPRLQLARAVTATVRFPTFSRQFVAYARGGPRALRLRRRLEKPAIRSVAGGPNAPAGTRLASGPPGAPGYVGAASAWPRIVRAVLGDGRAVVSSPCATQGRTRGSQTPPFWRPASGLARARGNSPGVRPKLPRQIYGLTSTKEEAGVGARRAHPQRPQRAGECCNPDFTSPRVANPP
jgi:hypothetical protein